MKKICNILRLPRFFLSVVVLPLFFITTRCPDIFTPPPQPQILNCPILLTMAARRCVKVEPPCTPSANWQPGDTLSITASQQAAPPFDVFNSLHLNFQTISSGNTLMGLVCQGSQELVNYQTGNALFQYTVQNAPFEGFYNISFTNPGALTVGIGSGFIEHAAYDYKYQDASVVLVAETGGGVAPYNYRWTANGVIMPTAPGDPPNVARDIIAKNTEYRVRVNDQGESQVLAAVVVFAPSSADPTAAFTISPQSVQTGQAVTLNSSGSTGNIIRWDWDFDWHGEIVEPFDQTINGTNGTTTTSWSTPGRKYIRLRVTTAAGNFHEIFQRITVG